MVLNASEAAKTLMKKRILDRYERTAEGKVVIDVSANRVEDLYENFDKTAPYHKKDLDEDLVFYLTECVREIGKVVFVIRFSLDAEPAEELRERVRTSVHKFFMYQRERELAAMKKMLRTSLIYFMIGIFVLGLSLWVKLMERQDSENIFLQQIFAEGLTIAAWVSLWESLAMFLINWWPYEQMTRLYWRIANAPVMFQSHSSVVSD
jgi:hypothetical protein